MKKMPKVSRRKYNLSSDIFRFEHEDPMYKYLQQKKRKEKEERVQQLKRLLESSSSSSSSSSMDSDSESHKEKRKKSKKKRKSKERQKAKTKVKDVNSKKREKLKELSSGQKAKQKKKKRQCDSEQLENVIVKSDNPSEKFFGGATSNCGESEQNIVFGPAVPLPPDTQMKQSDDSSKMPEDCGPVLKQTDSTTTVEKTDNDTKSKSSHPKVSAMDLQTELRRFKLQSMQLKGQVLGVSNESLS